LQFAKISAAGFNAKTAKKSVNASPASPVNTRTAERAFTLEMSLLCLITVNASYEQTHAILNFREAIHSAVHVSMGEADEIASQNLRFLR
jgi:hypothetical protein